MFSRQYREECLALNNRHKAEVKAFRRKYSAETTTIAYVSLAIVILGQALVTTGLNKSLRTKG